MNKYFCAFIVTMFVANSFAQSHLNFRLNQAGIMKVLKLAADYNLNTLNADKLKIPNDLYEFKVLGKDLAKNPFLQVLSEISDIEMNQVINGEVRYKDLPFYLETSEINIKGDIDRESIKTEITSKGERKFELKLSLNIVKLNLSAEKLILCESKIGKKCDKEGLTASAKDLKISLTKQRPIHLAAVFNVDLTGKIIQINLKTISTNLNSTNSAPIIDINFSSLEVPPLAIVVNGQRTQLDTSTLREKILEKKQFLGKKLLSFASEFVSLDLIELINKFLKNQKLPTSYEVIDYEKTFDSLYDDKFDYRSSQDNTYVHRDYEFHSVSTMSATTTKEASGNFNLAFKDLESLLQQLSFSLNIKNITTPNNADMEIHLTTQLKLNNWVYQVANTINHSSNGLPPLILNNFVNRQEHLQAVISEPLLNAILKAASDLKIIKDLIDSVDKEPGFWIDLANVHIPPQTTQGSLRLHVIAQAKVKLTDLSHDWSWDGFWTEVENEMGAFLERNNNQGVMYLPILFDVNLRFGKNVQGKPALITKVEFNENIAYSNIYKYPTNLNIASAKVRNGVIKGITKKMIPLFKDEFPLSLESYLTQKGVSFNAKSIKATSSYVIISLDLDKIDFTKINGNKE